MNKALIAIVIVIVLAVGGWLIFGNKNNNPGPSNNSSNGTSSNNTALDSHKAAAESQISIQNMLFTPSQITIAKGATVTWTNNDSVTHTVVDDLSNVGGPSSGDIAPGQKYSFTFTKTGSFQYHCSIHPSMRGTIVVK